MSIRALSLGVALTSAASLALSLLFTRIFSVTMYYHFAFFLVSLALLGIAVSGVAVYLLPRAFTPERSGWLAGLFAVLIGPLAALGLYVAVNNPMSVDLQAQNVERLVKLYAATALPFLASGLAITLALTRAQQHIGRVYAFDLVGAALGCLLIIPLIAWVGGPAAILVAGAVAALGGALLALPTRAVSAAGLVVFAALMAVGLGPAREGGLFRIVQGSKFLNESAVEFERWNAFSRITVSSGEADYKWIHIDADAATRIYSGEIARQGYEAPRRFSESRLAALVYSLRKEGPALIVGPGGGPDVVSALRAGVPRIVGVEINPLIAETVMREKYAGWNGDLYRNPRIQVMVDDGRSYVRRTGERFSSIQATLVDTWAASAAGAFTLSENNLYTADAFVDYLGKLAPDGVLSMTRWYGAPPIELVRLLGLGREALGRRGVPTAGHKAHFFVAADNRMATMLLKVSAFTPEDVAVLSRAASESGLRILYSPSGGVAQGDQALAQYFDWEPSTFYERVPFDITPTTDNRPFFFYTVKAADFTRLLGRMAHLERNNLGLVILQILLLISVGLTLALVVLPLWMFRREALSAQRGPKLRVLGYFLALGLGYILVELGLMQRFILFLGHPIYALAVVLATLLASSGLGSALSPRLEARFGLHGGVRRAVAALCAVLVLYALGLGPLFNALLGLPVGARMAVAALLVAGLGVWMGTLLPMGVKVARSLDPELVPWAWGLNGATSVVGSILAVVLSMHFGFNVTLMTGLLAYLAGTILLSRDVKPAAV
ncbi:MAG TPA: hypothetical protein VFB81_10630 [Myxococcales bacterium]|nr:hypothetical protein [Myxococcales bacterium]